MCVDVLVNRDFVSRAESVIFRLKMVCKLRGVVRSTRLQKGSRAYQRLIQNHMAFVAKMNQNGSHRMFVEKRLP